MGTIRRPQPGNCRSPNVFNAIERDFASVVQGDNVFRVVITADREDGEVFSEWVARRALAFDLVVASSHIGAQSSIYGTAGQCVRLYAQLVATLQSSTGQRQGEGLAGLLGQLAQDVEEERRVTGESFPEALSFRLKPLYDLTGGYDFRDAVVTYLDAQRSGDEHRAQMALAWLEATSQPKPSIARKLRLGARLRDVEVYGRLKLLGRLSRLSDRGGLVVLLTDAQELLSRRADVREATYSTMRQMLVDLHQDRAAPLALFIVGDASFHLKPQKGLQSHTELYDHLRPAFFGSPRLQSTEGPLLLVPPLAKRRLS